MGVMGTAARKVAELEQKLGSLDAEFAAWLSRSEEDGPFEKHHTQIRRVKTHLDRLVQRICEKVRAPAVPEQILKTCRAREQMILTVHRIWEFFRSKLILRHEPLFADYLKAADEFAWACYRPAQALAFPDPVQAGRKEPPLVFFNGGWSPFAVPRGRTFPAEDVPGEGLTAPDVRAVLDVLPVPVVGIPWYQPWHLPDALVLGHETGHIVAEDCGLGPELKQLLAGALAKAPKRLAAWQEWLGEVFADVYGCLAAGPAFVATLMDFLLDAPTAVQNEARIAPPWGDYPTKYLRILFNLRVLTNLGWKDEAASLLTSWQAAYGQTHAMLAFEPDLDAIAAALLDGPYPTFKSKALRDVLRFTRGQQRDAATVVDVLRDGGVPPSPDVRVLFVASRLLFEQDAQAYRKRRAALLAHLVTSLEPGLRAGEQELSEEQTARRDAADLAAADVLLEALEQKAFGAN